MIDLFHRATGFDNRRCGELFLAVAFCGGLLPVASALADPVQSEPDAKRWVVMLEDVRIESNKPNSETRYELSVYEMNLQECHQLIKRKPIASESAKTIANSILKRFVLPQLDENGHFGQQAGRSPVRIQVVVRKTTENRRLDVCLGIDEAEQLGVKDEVKNLITIANQHLATIGKGKAVRLSAGD